MPIHSELEEHHAKSSSLERFIARVEQNLHAEAVEEFYTESASISENMNAPRIGRDAQAARERALFLKVSSVKSSCVHPVFVSGDRVVIRWIFEFEWNDGRRSRMEELAWQRWVGECIAEETFFYDPVQAVPK